MPAIEVGKICVKTAGREAGKKCIVIEIVDNNFALITGPKAISGIKRRRANINHLEPTKDKIQIKRGATDEEITEELKTAGKLEVMAQTAKSTIS